MEKIVIIGASAGGATTAARLRRISPETPITLYEQKEYTSLADDSYLHFLNGDIESFKEMQMRSQVMLKEMYDINVKNNHKVLSIHSKEKYILSKNLITNELSKADYSSLVIATGSKIAKLEMTSNYDNVFYFDELSDLVKLKNKIKESSIDSISIIGNNKESVEAANFFISKKIKVDLIVSDEQVLKNIFDEDLAQFIQKSMYDSKVTIHFNKKIELIQNGNIFIDNKIIESSAILVTGPKLPNVQLAENVNLSLGDSGGILINAGMMTSAQDIYAIGSCVENTLYGFSKSGSYSSEGHSQQSARKLANNLVFNQKEEISKLIKTSILTFNKVIYATIGLTEDDCKKNTIDYGVSIVVPGDMLRILPGARPVFYKLIFSKVTFEVLGAQVVGRKHIIKHLDTISVAIYNQNTIYDLKEYQLGYSPEYSNAKEATNIAALNAINIVENKLKVINFTELREKMVGDYCIIDTRTKKAFNKHHIKGAINIPFENINESIHKIPRDKPIYLYCTIGQRSSYIAMILKKKGFDNIYNIQGSMLIISFYEYFKDHYFNRESILNDYYLLDYY